MAPGFAVQTINMKEAIIMKHTVIKLGGSVLRGPGDAEAILEILDGYSGPLVVVVSALKGVTDRLGAALSSSARPSALISGLGEEYGRLARAFAAPPAAEAAALMQIRRLLGGLEALFGSVSPAPEGCGTSMDGRERCARILATGERLSAVCLSLALASLGRPAPVIEPGKLGLIARGVEEGSEYALADIGASAPLIRAALGSRDAAVVPGFYGVGEDGVHRLFGRGGSDYSAAVIAACLGAGSCDLIKDVAGLYTADPSLVHGARLVAELSYEEAEALAQGGASSTPSPLRGASARRRRPAAYTGRPFLHGSDLRGPRLRLGRPGALRLGAQTRPDGQRRNHRRGLRLRLKIGGPSHQGLRGERLPGAGLHPRLGYGFLSRPRRGLARR